MQEKEIVYGYHAVKALINTHPQLLAVIYLQRGQDDKRRAEIIALADQYQIKVVQATKNDLSQKVTGVHQGIVAVCHSLPQYSEKDLDALIAAQSEATLLLILDGVQDPHNLGACLRTANALGVHAVIAPKDKAVGLNATVRKVACGAATLTPFIAVTNLARTLRHLQDQGIWLVGTCAEAEQSLQTIDLTGPVGLIMGGEGQGMRRLTRQHCDFLANIPMRGSVASFNVSVATAIGLYEVWRQRG